MTDTISTLMNYKDFLARSERPAVRPTIWKWRDVQNKLDEVAKTDPLSAGRWAVSLVHEDTGEAAGVCPGLNMLVQVFGPGEHAKRHRHSNFAIFVVREGKGYTIIDGERIDWQTGDVFLAPPWVMHEHCNASDTDQAVLYTIQDVPTVSGKGVWFFQGSSGEGFEHKVAPEKEGAT
jgi:gentisate 1,2-dioxygenase